MTAPAESVLVTGAGGFIGSHLAEACLKQGYKVRAFVHYNSRNNWGWLETSEYRDEMEVVSGDVRDYDSVARAVKGSTWIFHLAALIGIPYSYVTPLAYVRTNVEGTYNVLQAARELASEQVLIASTSETYGSAQYSPIDEEHPLVAQSPYAASKIAADQLALSFYRSFDLPVKVVRPFNTYGPRQSARAIIPTIVTQILNGERILKMGDTSPTRDLTFVEDTVDGFLKILTADELIGEVTNIGMNEEISIGDLVGLIARLVGTEVKTQMTAERMRPERSEVRILHCDNTKLLEHTDWRPRFNIETGLAATVEWFRSNLRAYKAELYNV